MNGSAPAGRALPSAAFLACSWTWCIGMWIPVYLIHDFGRWGWVIFAVPNVIGATMVGFIHRTPDAVAKFRARGIEPMRWFSIITILFHVGFLGWTFWERPPSFLPSNAGLFAPLLAVAGGAALSKLSWNAWGRLALLIIGGMLALLAFFVVLQLASVLVSGVFFDPQALLGLDIPRATGVVTDSFALPLYATGVAFGFLLCPHLDLTILRAREKTPGRAGDAAFLLGFGVFFLMMIALTAFYAAGILSGWFSEYLLLHFMVQGTFTIGAHLRELRIDGWPRILGPGRSFPVGFIVLVLALAALAPISKLDPNILGTPSSTRVAYDSFLWFYGLPFPAAALFLLRKRPLNTMFWASLVLATPFMAAGAIGAIWWAVPVGVALPIAALLMSPKTPEKALA